MNNQVIKYLWIDNSYSRKIFGKKRTASENHVLMENPKWNYVPYNMDLEPVNKYAPGADVLVCIKLRLSGGQYVPEIGLFDPSVTNPIRDYDPINQVSINVPKIPKIATVHSDMLGGYSVSIGGKDKQQTLDYHKRTHNKYSEAEFMVDSTGKLHQENIQPIVKVVLAVPTVVAEINSVRPR